MKRARFCAVIVDLILIILTLSFIFGNSLQNVETSTKTSEGIVEKVEKLPPVQNAIKEEKLTHGGLVEIIRSLAHVAEFALLGAEIMLLVLLLELKPVNLWVFAPLGLCLLVGTTDEWIQSFSDRSPELVDILKDMLGSLIGGAVAFGAYFGVKRLFEKKNK